MKFTALMEVKSTLFPPFGMVISADVFPLHVLLLCPIVRQFLQHLWKSKSILFPSFGMILSVDVFPLHALLLCPIVRQFLQTTDLDCLARLGLLVDSSFFLFLAFFGLP